jgi:flagellin
MDGLYLSNAAQVLLQQGKTQNALETSVKRLSSGLRINSAADDPSGLAIADTLSAKASGFQRAAQNVQDANNALAVADGAIQSITSILQSVRKLIVQANTDITSPSDDQDIQTQINQQLQEINKISQNTQFNGRNLLDGSLDSSPGSPPTITDVSGQLGQNPTVQNYDGAGNAGPLITAVTAGVTPPAPALTFTATVTGYDPVNVTDPIAGPQGPGYYLELSAYSADPDFGPAQVQTVAVPDTGVLPVSASVNWQNLTQPALSFTISNLTPADVGASQTFVTTAAVMPSGGHSLNIQDGASEGNTVTLNIGGVNTTSLGINNISVLAPITIDALGNLAQSTSNGTAATDAEYRIDGAITTITGQSAQIGAQITALNDDADNDTTAATNLTASASNISDTDVGTEMTTYTRTQIVASYQYNLLNQTFAISQLILKLVS